MSDVPSTITDPDPTLLYPPPAPAGPPAPADPGSSAVGNVQDQLETAFKQAAREADVGRAPEGKEPARKPGQRGPDKRPRRKSGESDDNLFAQRPPPPAAQVFSVPVLAPVAPVPPPVDDKSLRVGIEGIVRLLEGVAALYLAKAAADANAGPEISRRVIEGSKPMPEVRESMINGGVECWKKYFPNTPIGPEFELIGAFGLWGKQIFDLTAEIRKLREPAAA